MKKKSEKPPISLFASCGKQREKEADFGNAYYSMHTTAKVCAAPFRLVLLSVCGTFLCFSSSSKVIPPANELFTRLGGGGGM